MLDGSGGRRGRKGSATPDELAREVAFTLSNLAAGTPRQMRATLRAGVLPGLFHMMAPFVEEASERNARNFRGEEAPPPFWPKTDWARPSRSSTCCCAARRRSGSERCAQDATCCLPDLYCMR